jgi:hypothetical protein
MGLATLLRGRTSPAQRQAALQLAALTLAAAGPAWLLAPSAVRTSLAMYALVQSFIASHVTLRRSVPSGATHAAALC